MNWMSSLNTSRNGRESLFGSRNIPPGSQNQHRRGQSLTATGISKDSDENLDLFSKNRRTLSVTSSDESFDVSVKLGRLSVGSMKLSKSGMDDLLSSSEGGKHDYDWLLTPPGTPVLQPSEGESQIKLGMHPRSSSLVRAASTTKASRLSISQSDNIHPRQGRSNSVTRSSVSTSQYNSNSSSRTQSILNTSSASVSSYIRQSSPVTRSPTLARPSTPGSRSTASRPSTPSRGRSASATSTADRIKSSQTSRPSSPISRHHVPANQHSPTATSVRSLSRPSTPTRRNAGLSPSPPVSSSISVGRIQSDGRIPASASRPSSPSPRVRPQSQTVVPPDFPLETPPNLRTTFPNRPVSAGRSRNRGAVNMKGSSEHQAANQMPRRPSSPVVSRGRLNEPQGRGRIQGNGHVDVSEPRKTSPANEIVMRKPVRSSSPSSESNGGYGRTISKKSLDMAIRHMDIKNGAGSNRSFSGTTLFPQSVRSSTSRMHSVRTSSAPASNGSLHTGIHDMDEGSYSDLVISNGHEQDDVRCPAKLNQVDIYESSRYDTMLLKEDLNHTSWLHTGDDQGPIFDHGLELLPEPFGVYYSI